MIFIDIYFFKEKEIYIINIKIKLIYQFICNLQQLNIFIFICKQINFEIYFNIY
jgi:hypothetical protein